MKSLWGVILFFCLIMIAVVLCKPGDTGKIPHGMFGRWETTEPKYKDRFFDLSADRVIFGRGNLGDSYFIIDEIRKDPESGQPLYTAVFEDRDGNSYSRSFYFKNRKDSEVLFFKNQEDIIWRKTDHRDDRAVD